jgi:hypothetical protein
MNQRPIPNEEGKIRRELIASIVVQDWPWTAENAPLIGEYRPWPGNPQARPNHAVGRNSRDQNKRELIASIVVQDWPWTAENAPLIGEYRPWPGNPQDRPNHAVGRNSRDQDNLDNKTTFSSNDNHSSSQ